MSLEHMVTALGATDIRSPAKFVLVAIADLAGKNGRARTTVEALARVTLLDESNVERCLAELTAAEMITVEARREVFLTILLVPSGGQG